MDTFEQLSFDQQPTKSSWKLNELTKVDQNGKTRNWQIGFDGSTGQLYTVHGLSTSLTTDRRAVVPKAKRTIQEQALQEARNRYTKKVRDGYSTQGGIHTSMVNVQLANKYKSTSIKGFPVLAQPKLDGIRAYALMSGGSVALKSRKHIEFPFLEQVKEEIAKILSVLPAGSALDGELYIHGKSFQTLSSIIRMKNKKHALNDEITYNVFDVIIGTDMSSDMRMGHLKMAFGGLNLKSVVLVESTLICSHQDLDLYNDRCVSDGYEGVMIRHIASSLPTKHQHLSLYKGGRNNALMKYKKFSDEEGVIIDILQGTGREKGKAIFEVRDPRGNIFRIRPEGNFKRRGHIYDNRAKYIGLSVTYSFQCLSDEGVPIFAVAKDIRDCES